MQNSGGKSRLLKLGATRQAHDSSQPRPVSKDTQAHKAVSGQKQPDYEKLGRLLFAVGQSGTKNQRKLYKIAFWNGIWGGLGGAIGATLVLAILLWITALLGQIPLLGPALDLINDNLSSRQTTRLD